ncbi:MAG: sulfite exporter TauE/SafE family protein [Candidatus Rokubacteria bacterium]|nr:sulfite exporter TauE/SafE family protein [Candidatus Rokubacteria bacterium]
MKGAIGFGFPTLATPLLALFVDAKTAVVVLIVPNIVMDGIQAVRRGRVAATGRRLAVLLVFGASGTVLGTRLLVGLPSESVTLILGCVVLVFVALNVTRFRPRVPARWEGWLAPPVGFVAGVVGGVTNVPSTLLVIYFYALGMAKDEFVRSVSVAFLFYKLFQLGAVVYYGLLGWWLLGVSIALTGLGLSAFGVGLRLQDRLDQVAFNRAVLVFLGALGLWLSIRAGL